MKRRHCFNVILIITLTMALFVSPVKSSADPVIDVWYGTSQKFGNIGTPQNYINIVGNVFDPTWEIDTLSYTLNGGTPLYPASPLSIGIDGGRRLIGEGDFNIDIPIGDSNLIDGNNAVVITAVPTSGNTTTETVNFTYSSTNTWPLPYSVDWSAVSDIQDVAQSVDGEWIVSADGVSCVDIGYDRLLAMGDLDWTDYEVVVPITIHSVTDGLLPDGHGTPLLGIIMRWTGHTDNPIADTQPKAGWIPNGEIAGWDWDSWDPEGGKWNSTELEFYNAGISQSTTVELETTYMFRVRVESTPGKGGLYRLKVWKQSDSEPVDWNLTYQADATNLDHGSFLLIAHYVDATFGDVTVTSLLPGPQAPVITSTPVTSATYGLVYRYDVEATGNPTPTYSLTVAPAGMTIDETTGLIQWAPTGVGTFNVTVVATNDEGSVTQPFTITVAEGVLSTIVSDDFTSATLDSAWTFEDPQGDGSYTLTRDLPDDAWINISVPAAASHEMFTEGIKAPHILQACNDTDFEVEVKFESGVSQQYQEQGILVKQDADTYLRFEFYSNGSNTFLYAASYDTGGQGNVTNTNIGDNNSAPLYMRVKRVGNQWTQTYSLDGEAWNAGATFSYEMTVAGIGPYAGNATGISSPAHTASIDYFFNTFSPIAPEDGYTVTFTSVGNGSLTGTTTQKVEAGGDCTAVTAVPNEGYSFTNWTGTGGFSDTTENPLTVTNVQSDMTITANFTSALNEYTVTFNTSGNGSLIGSTTQTVTHGGNCTAVNAVPNAGYSFTNWTGTGGFSTTTANPLTVTNVTSNMTITANFTAILPGQYTLTVNTVGNGSVTLDPAGDTYEAGTEVQLTATPDLNWAFDGWDGNVADEDDKVTTIVMNSNQTVTANFAPDDDNDGVPDQEEQGPDGTDDTYDGNNDGTPDYRQDNVYSGHSYDMDGDGIGDYYVTLEFEDTVTVESLEVTGNPDPANAPANVDFPYGFFNFTVSNLGVDGKTTVTLFLDPAGDEPDTYWKYGPTPVNPAPHWYEFLYDAATDTGAEINGHIITLHFVDGKRGDHSPDADKISDPGAPGVKASSGSGDGGGGCFIGAAAY